MPCESTPRPRKRKLKEKIRPTARFVAITALADAAASTFPSCEGVGAQVNAGSFATRQLEQDADFVSLDARDRSFARLLVATVERRRGQIDNVLKCCVKKSPKGKHSHLVQATLRVGVAQLVFLRTPPFAAVKETVQVLRKHPNNVPEPMIKFANGVLRTLSRPTADETSVTHELFAQKLLREKTSPLDNFAPWLLKQWQKDWGEQTTKIMCEEMMPSEESSSHRTDLTTKYSMGAMQGDEEIELHALMSKLGEGSILLPQGSIRVPASLKGDVKNWPDYDKGTWWVQDASSTLPASLLTRSLLQYSEDNLEDMHVVDMCSAPGGKTSQLLSAGFGHVTAVEASPRRSRRLIENLNRLGLGEKCQVVVQEGQSWTPDHVVHGILCDVPCSATGTGARRPDVLRRDSDIKELLETQQSLASHCANNILEPGGVMVYATCSTLKEESENQARKLESLEGLETLRIQADEVPGFEDAIDENGWIRVLPGTLPGDLRSADGFFVARLIKT
ncbi:hypothetical protein ACHAWF_013101 [Thalassiosira exigua]